MLDSLFGQLVETLASAASPGMGISKPQAGAGTYRPGSYLPYLGSVIGPAYALQAGRKVPGTC